jgi:hypothetical protein
MKTCADAIDPSARKESFMSAATRKQPSIVRVWRGRTSRRRANEYEAYNYNGGSERIPEPELYDSRIASRGDPSEKRIDPRSVRIPEIHSIEQIEELGSEFEPM